MKNEAHPQPLPVEGLGGSLLHEDARDGGCGFPLVELRLALRMIHQVGEAEQLHGAELPVVAHAGLQLVVADRSCDGFSFRGEFCLQLAQRHGKQLLQPAAFCGRILLRKYFHGAACRHINDLLAEAEE